MVVVFVAVLAMVTMLAVGVMGMRMRMRMRMGSMFSTPSMLSTLRLLEFGLLE